jgi:hypothetical protein
MIKTHKTLIETEDFTWQALHQGALDRVLTKHLFFWDHHTATA